MEQTTQTLNDRAMAAVRTVCARIDAECRAQHMSTASLARSIGTTQYRARALRTGTTGRVTITGILGAARALNVDLIKLMEGTDKAMATA